MGYITRTSSGGLMPDTEYRIGSLEKKMDTVCSDVKQILENHLPHIQSDIVQVKTELRIFGAIILLAIGALIKVVLG